MPRLIWIAVVIALVLAASISLSREVSPTARLIQQGAIISAIALPLGWIVLEFLGDLRRAWRRMNSRPYL
jgi:hypothetical protein